MPVKPTAVLPNGSARALSMTAKWESAVAVIRIAHLTTTKMEIYATILTQILFIAGTDNAVRAETVVVHRVDIAVWAVQLQEAEMVEQIRVVLPEIHPEVPVAMVETEGTPLEEAHPMVSHLHRLQRLVTITIHASRQRS